MSAALQEPINIQRFGHRVPVRIIAPDGTVTEGLGLIDTGSTWTFVDVDLPPTGHGDSYHCGCGGHYPVNQVHGVLEAAGHRIEGLWSGVSLGAVGAVAVLGLDFLSQFKLTVEGGEHKLEKLQ